jgi:hypothetical protein
MEMKAIATKRDEVVLRAFEDGVQPPVAAHPGEGAFNHPADAGRNEPSVAVAGNCLDGDAELLIGLCQTLAAVAEVVERRKPLSASVRRTGTMTFRDRCSAAPVAPARLRVVQSADANGGLSGRLPLNNGRASFPAARRWLCCLPAGAGCCC